MRILNLILGFALMGLLPSAYAQNGSGYSGPTKGGASVPTHVSKKFQFHQLQRTHRRCSQVIVDDVLDGLNQFYSWGLNPYQDFELQYKGTDPGNPTLNPTVSSLFKMVSKNLVNQERIEVTANFNGMLGELQIRVVALPRGYRDTSGYPPEPMQGTPVILEPRSIAFLRADLPVYSWKVQDESTYDQMGNKLSGETFIMEPKLIIKSSKPLKDFDWIPLVNAVTKAPTSLGYDVQAFVGCLETIY